MTDRFHLSSSITGSSREQITEAITKSKLPEEIWVYRPGEENPERPFLVIAETFLTQKQVREEFKKGAEDVFAAYSKEDIIRHLNL